MVSQKPTFPLARVVINLFYSFPKLVLTNILFAIPLSVFFVALWAVSSIEGISYVASVLIRLAVIIPVFPFYAGVAQITARLVKGDKNISVYKNFVVAVKENFLRFLVHGIVIFAAVIFSYLSIRLYASMLAQNSVFLFLMIISIIVSVFFAFMFFYIPSMTVTFDISMKNIYRNSLLMSFGELKKNLTAVFGLFLLFVICSTFLFACMGNAVAIVIVSAVLMIFIVPAVSTFIINSAVYERMYAMIIDNTSESKSIDEKIAKKQKEAVKSSDEAKKINEEFKEKLRKFEIDENADGDEYIYFNGKMIKRSVLIKMKKDAEESELN